MFPQFLVILPLRRVSVFEWYGVSVRLPLSAGHFNSPTPFSLQSGIRFLFSRYHSPLPPEPKPYARTFDVSELVHFPGSFSDFTSHVLFRFLPFPPDQCRLRVLIKPL